MKLTEYDPFEVHTLDRTGSDRFLKYEAIRPRCAICKKAFGFDWQGKAFAICAHKTNGDSSCELSESTS